MSEQFVELEDRLISGLGILQIPNEDKWRYFRIWVNLIREPEPQFLNNKWNPSRGEYAKITFISEGYVYREEVMRYEKEYFAFPAKEAAGYLASPLACLFQVVFNKLEKIETLLGAPPTPPTLVIPIEPVLQVRTQVQFACRDGCAIQVVLEGLEEDVVCPEGEPNPKRSDKPDNELPKVPVGEAIDVSPAYDGETDNGNTVPDPNDEQAPPADFPVGNECQEVVVTILWETNIDPPGNTATATYYGPVTKVELLQDSQGVSVLVESRGRSTNSTSCQPQLVDDFLRTISPPDGFINYELISVVAQ